MAQSIRRREAVAECDAAAENLSRGDPKKEVRDWCCNIVGTVGWLAVDRVATETRCLEGACEVLGSLQISHSTVSKLKAIE